MFTKGMPRRAEDMLWGSAIYSGLYSVLIERDLVPAHEFKDANHQIHSCVFQKKSPSFHHTDSD